MANKLESTTFVNPTITGTLTLPTLYNGTIPRANLAQQSATLISLPLHEARIHDSATLAVLPTTSAADDLGLTIGTFGTNSLQIRTYDVKSAGAVTLYCRWPAVYVPHDYELAATAAVRLYAGMITTIADATATADVECYVSDGEAAVGADVCTTAAQSINSLTFADYDFQLGTTLVAGDILDIRVTVAVNDAATGTAVIGAIGKAYLVFDRR